MPLNCLNPQLSKIPQDKIQAPWMYTLFPHQPILAPSVLNLHTLVYSGARARMPSLRPLVSLIGSSCFHSRSPLRDAVLWFGTPLPALSIPRHQEWLSPLDSHSGHWLISAIYGLQVCSLQGEGGLRPNARAQHTCGPQLMVGD